MRISIGNDIGKRKRGYCIVSVRGRILERGQYFNTQADTRRCARTTLDRYGKTGRCTVTCRDPGIQGRLGT